MRALAPAPAPDRAALIKAIHAIARALAHYGFDDATRRAWQAQQTGVASCKDMTLAQLQHVRRALELMADALPAAPRPSRRGRDERLPAEPPTPEQLRKIEHLYDHLGVKQRPRIVLALARRATGHPWPQTRAEANRLIEALKAMAARGWRPRAEEDEAS